MQVIKYIYIWFHSKELAERNILLTFYILPDWTGVLECPLLKYFLSSLKYLSP